MSQESVSPTSVKSDDEYRQLAEQHHQYESRLGELAEKAVLSDDEQVEEATLKKKKLQLKDKMRPSPAVTARSSHGAAGGARLTPESDESRIHHPGAARVPGGGASSPGGVSAAAPRSCPACSRPAICFSASGPSSGRSRAILPRPRRSSAWR